METPHILEDVDYTIKEKHGTDRGIRIHIFPLSGYMVFGDSMLVTADGNQRLNHTEKKSFVKDI